HIGNGLQPLVGLRVCLESLIQGPSLQFRYGQFIVHELLYYTLLLDVQDQNSIRYILVCPSVQIAPSHVPHNCWIIAGSGRTSCHLSLGRSEGCFDSVMSSTIPAATLPILPKCRC